MGAFAPSGDVEGAVGLAAGGAGAGACAGSSEEEVVGAEARWQAAKQSTISPTFRLAQIIHSGRICVISGAIIPYGAGDDCSLTGRDKVGTIGGV